MVARFAVIKVVYACGLVVEVNVARVYESCVPREAELMAKSYVNSHIGVVQDPQHRTDLFVRPISNVTSDVHTRPTVKMKAVSGVQEKSPTGLHQKAG